MKYYWRGDGLPHKCIDCKYCNVENMKCRPESKDCAEEYALDEHDINTEAICDFFVRKEDVDVNDNKWGWQGSN